MSQLLWNAKILNSRFFNTNILNLYLGFWHSKIMDSDFDAILWRDHQIPFLFQYFTKQNLEQSSFELNILPPNTNINDTFIQGQPRDKVKYSEILARFEYTQQTE